MRGTAETPPPEFGEPRPLQPDGAVDPMSLYAATRTALIEALHTGSSHDREGPAKTCGACSVGVDRLLDARTADGVVVLSDADDVYRDAYEEGRAEVRSRVEATLADFKAQPQASTNLLADLAERVRAALTDPDA